MLTLGAQAAKRLAFIKLLYQQGVEQGRLPMPMAATSLLSLHDSVEMFLVLTGDSLHAPLDARVDFLEYWRKLRMGGAGVQLSAVAGMRRLHDHRNGLKHVGNTPVPDVVAQAVSDTTGFFEDNVPRVFGIDFFTLDMSDVISQPHIRDLAKQAVSRFAAGSHMEGMGDLALAFRDLFDDQVQGSGWLPAASLGRPMRENPSWGNEIAHTLAALHNPGTQNGPTPREEKIGRMISDTAHAVAGMQKVLHLMALGIGYEEYLRFDQLTPDVHGSRSHPRLTVPTGYAPTEEEFDFCHQFIVTVSVRLESARSHRRSPSWASGATDADETFAHE
ncbi:hypothetical protein [Streptomyces sp. NPDC048462]|uniref:hypothetical protein n=1 Tax=Streptomyces sp. NPDC048462 TaxID=3365555 RepID=UPI0037204377